MEESHGTRVRSWLFSSCLVFVVYVMESSDSMIGQKRIDLVVKDGFGIDFQDGFLPGNHVSLILNSIIQIKH